MIGTGVLKRINAKHGKNARGDWTAYSICVGPAADNDHDTWYRLGFEAPKVNEGSVVKFDYEEDARGNKKVVGDILVDKTATPAAPAKGKGGGYKGGITNDARQNSIVRQNATTTATNIFGVMCANDLIDLPKKKADRFDFALEVITEIADGLFPVLLSPPTVDELAERGIDKADEDVPEFKDDDLDKAFDNDEDKWEAV